MNRTIKAIERHMIPQSKAVSVQSRVPSLIADWQQRRTRNVIRTRATKAALIICAAAGRDDRECGSLEDSAMIPMIIAWVLILALFGFPAEKSNENRFLR
jgi:hypothetical protein